MKVYKLNNDNGNQDTTQHIAQTTTTKVEQNRQIVDSNLSDIKVSRDYVQNDDDVKKIRVIQENEFLPRNNNTNFTYSPQEPNSKTTVTLKETLTSGIKAVAVDDNRNIDDYIVHTEPQPHTNESKYYNEQTFTKTTKSQVNDVDEINEHNKNKHFNRETHLIEKEPHIVPTKDMQDLKEVRQSVREYKTTVSNDIYKEPVPIERDRSIPPKQSEPNNTYETRPGTNKYIIETVSKVFDETDHPPKADTYSKPKETVKHEVVSEIHTKQQHTTYKTDYTSKRISVDISPTHDAFARSLRAVSPDHDQKHGSPVPSNASFRRSVTPDKHINDNKHHFTKEIQANKKISPGADSERGTKRVSPPKQAELKNIKASDILEKKIPQEVTADFYNIQTNQKSVHTKTTTTARPHSSKPSVQLPKDTNSGKHENSSLIKHPKNQLPDKRPTSLNVTTTVTTRTTKKITERSPTSPLTPTKDKPHDKLLKRRDTYEERCRQILGIDKTTDEGCIPNSQQQPQKPRRSSDKMLPSPTKDAKSKTTNITTTVSRTDQYNRKDIQEYPPQIRRSPEKMPKEKPVESQHIRETTKPDNKILKQPHPEAVYQSPQISAPIFDTHIHFTDLDDTPVESSQVPVGHPYRSQPVKGQTSPLANRIDLIEHPSQIRRSPETYPVPKKASPEATQIVRQPSPAKQKTPIQSTIHTSDTTIIQSSTKKQQSPEKLPRQASPSKKRPGVLEYPSQAKQPQETIVTPKQKIPVKEVPKTQSASTINKQITKEILLSEIENSSETFTAHNKKLDQHEYSAQKQSSPDKFSKPRPTSPTKHKPGLSEYPSQTKPSPTERKSSPPKEKSLKSKQQPIESPRQTSPSKEKQLNHNFANKDIKELTQSSITEEHRLITKDAIQDYSLPDSSEYSPPAEDEDYEKTVNTLFDFYNEQTVVKDEHSKRKPTHPNDTTDNISKPKDVLSSTMVNQKDEKVTRIQYTVTGDVFEEKLPANYRTTQIVNVEHALQKVDFPNEKSDKSTPKQLKEYKTTPTPEEIITLTEEIETRTYPHLHEYPTTLKETKINYTEDDKQFSDFYQSQTYKINDTVSSEKTYDSNTITRRPKGIPRFPPYSTSDDEVKITDTDNVIINEVTRLESSEGPEIKKTSSQCRYSPEKYASQNLPHQIQVVKTQSVVVDSASTRKLQAEAKQVHPDEEGEFLTLTTHESHVPNDESLYRTYSSTLTIPTQIEPTDTQIRPEESLPENVQTNCYTQPNLTKTKPNIQTRVSPEKGSPKQPSKKTTDASKIAKDVESTKGNFIRQSPKISSNKLFDENTNLTIENYDVITKKLLEATDLSKQQPSVQEYPTQIKHEPEKSQIKQVLKTSVIVSSKYPTQVESTNKISDKPKNKVSSSQNTNLLYSSPTKRLSHDISRTDKYEEITSDSIQTTTSRPHRHPLTKPAAAFKKPNDQIHPLHASPLHKASPTKKFAGGVDILSKTDSPTISESKPINNKPNFTSPYQPPEEKYFIEETVEEKRITQLEGVPNINEPACTKKLISNLCREEEIRKNQKSNLYEIHKTVKKENPKKTINLEFIKNEQDDAKYSSVELEKIDKEVIADTETQEKRLQHPSKPLRDEADYTHDSHDQYTYQDRQPKVSKQPESKEKVPSSKKDTARPIPSKPLKKQETPLNKVYQVTEHRKSSTTSEKGDTNYSKIATPKNHTPRSSQSPQRSDINTIRKSDIQITTTSRTPHTKTVPEKTVSKTTQSTMQTSKQVKPIESPSVHRISSYTEDTVQTKNDYNSVLTTQTTIVNVPVQPLSKNAKDVARKTPVRSIPLNETLKSTSKVEEAKKIYSKQTEISRKHPQKDTIQHSQNVPNIKGQPGPGKKPLVTATIQVPSKTNFKSNQKDQLAPKKQPLPAKEISTSENEVVDNKVSQNIVTTKSVIINNDFTKDADVIITLQRSTSSREPTPNRVCPRPTSGEEDYETPRYPDKINEPEEYGRKPFYIHAPRSDIPDYGNENSDVRIRVDRVEESDESLLTVNQKVNKFVNEAEKLTRTEKINLDRDQKIMLKSDDSDNLKDLNYLNTEDVPERPKSPRCKNYSHDIPDESYTTVSQRVSQYIKAAETTNSSPKPRASEFSPNKKQPDYTQIDKKVKNAEHLTSVNNKIHASTKEQKVKEFTKPIDLSKPNPTPIEPHAIEPGYRQIEIEEQTYIENVSLVKDTPKQTLDSSVTFPNQQNKTDERHGHKKQTYQTDAKLKSIKKGDEPKHILSTTGRLRSTETIRKAKELFEDNIRHLKGKNEESQEEEKLVKKLTYEGEIDKKHFVTKPTEQELGYMKPLDKSLRPTRHHDNEKLHLNKPQTTFDVAQEVPTYMKPFDKSSRPHDKSPVHQPEISHTHRVTEETSHHHSAQYSYDEKLQTIRSQTKYTESEIPGYMKPLHKTPKTHDYHPSQHPYDEQLLHDKYHTKTSESEPVPSYMKPLDRSSRPHEQHPTQRLNDENLQPEIHQTKYVEEEKVPGYMKPLDRSIKPHDYYPTEHPNDEKLQPNMHPVKSPEPEIVPGYMKPLDRNLKSHDSHSIQHPDKAPQSDKLQTNVFEHDVVPGYMKPLDRNPIPHDYHLTQHTYDDTLQSDRFQTNTPEPKLVPGYMKPLDRSTRPYDYHTTQQPYDETLHPDKSQAITPEPEQVPNYMKPLDRSSKPQQDHSTHYHYEEKLQLDSHEIKSAEPQNLPSYMKPLDRNIKQHDNYSTQHHNDENLQSDRYQIRSSEHEVVSSYIKPLDRNSKPHEHHPTQTMHTDKPLTKLSEHDLVPRYMKPLDRSSRPHHHDLTQQPYDEELQPDVTETIFPEQEQVPGYMKPLNRGPRPHDHHQTQHPDDEEPEGIQTESPNIREPSVESLPHYMWPLNRTSHDHSEEHERSPSRSLVDTPDSQIKKVSRGSTPDKHIPGYMKPLDRQANQTKHTKFGVTLKSTNTPKTQRPSQSKVFQSIDITSLLSKPEFDNIFDIEVLEVLLEKATNYEQQSKIRTQIRNVKQNSINNMQTQNEDAKRTYPQSSQVNKISHEVKGSLNTNKQLIYLKNTDEVEQHYASTQKIKQTNVDDTPNEPQERTIKKQLSTTQKSTPDKSKADFLNREDKPSWLIQRNLKKVSESPHKITTTTTTKQIISKTSSKDNEPTSVITSSYGVGPTDKNGSPLFGLKALRVQNQTESKKVQGTVIQSHYYSKNGQEPVGEVRVTKYSSDPRDLEGHDLEDKDGVVSVTTIQKIGPKETFGQETRTQHFVDTSDEQFDDIIKKTSGTQVVRRGSVKEVSRKFIDNAVETSKIDKQSSYPKAGLILRTSSLKDTSKHDAKQHTTAEAQDSVTSVRVTKTVTSSEGSGAKTFLTNRTKVHGVKDIISRMKNSEEDVQIGDSAEDIEAKTLLNKFIGSQVILSGMESKPSSSPPGTMSFKRTTTTTTTTSSGSEKPTVITRTFTHPITVEDLDTVCDEDTLKLLLERSTEYEERQNIRTRLHNIMAEQEEAETNKSTITEGPVTTNTVTTRVTSQQVTKKPLSPFAKFQQLDRQNSLNSPGTPRTPTGSGPLFKFTDPELSRQASTVKERLLQWCQMKTKEYENVQLDNFSSSWSDGLAFCALIHHFLPDAFDYHALTSKDRRYNFDLAFRIADEKANIAPLLDVDDMVATRKPDWKCVFTYVQTIYARFKNED